MVLDRTNNKEVKYALKHCLPEFSHINHYWDEQRQCVVAKILPGEFYMTRGAISIATTLGSCISACIWDDVTGIGGMNHFMLPATDKDVTDVNWGQRGLVTDATRYGNYAMEHLINILGIKSLLNSPLLHFSSQANTFIHCDRQRLSSTHAT